MGVDGKTATEYAKALEANLQSLLDRAKSGTYHAPPVRRVHIPKGDGKETRPIGIPTLEDKILQRAVAMVLEAVWRRSPPVPFPDIRPIPGRPSPDGARRLTGRPEADQIQGMQLVECATARGDQ